MFAPFSDFFRRSPASSSADASAPVQAIRVRHPREPRSRRLERMLVAGWVLVLLKSVAVWWLCHAYPEVKVGAWWVIAPTLLFASLCTLLYWKRD